MSFNLFEILETFEEMVSDVKSQGKDWNLKQINKNIEIISLTKGQRDSGHKIDQFNL